MDENEVLPRQLWLVVVKDLAYKGEKLEYNIACAQTADLAVQYCVDKQHELHVVTQLTDEVMDRVFGNVACCITPLEA